MVIQIDIDGTIDKATEFFKWLTNNLRKDGHRVLIVSSRTYSPDNQRETINELGSYDVLYDKLILTPELKELDVRRIPPDMHPAHKLYIYKLFTAKDNNVDILFDDCGITTELFRKYLPHIKVFRLIP